MTLEEWMQQVMAQAEELFPEKGIALVVTDCVTDDAPEGSHGYVDLVSSIDADDLEEVFDRVRDLLSAPDIVPSYLN